MAQDKEIVEGSHPGEPGCACSLTNIVNYLVNKQGVYMQQVVKVMDTQADFLVIMIRYAEKVSLSDAYRVYDRS